MSKSHRARKKNVEEVDFASLFRRFEHEYGRACVRLTAQLELGYPEITKPSRRTGRALRTICFTVWCCCREADQKLIPPLLNAAVLLSAQDDYYDNPRIPAAQKDSFCSAINRALRNGSFGDLEGSPQLRDLMSLWSYVAGTIPQSAREVQSLWIEMACQMNDAMATENRSLRRATITYEEYMRTAVHSIGMVFIWATYLAHEHVPLTTLGKMVPILIQGARIVRWSNDIASCRQLSTKKNAVTLARGKSPGFRILRLVVQESRAFHRSVEALDVGAHVRSVLVNSMDFLREFYQRSDFDRGRIW